MSVGARIFVAIIFIVVGFSFMATTAILYYEFKNTDWFSFAVFYSHLFIFFPTFGCLALIAFYIPSCVFVDMYWNHIPFGRIRFLFGFIVICAGSYFIATSILKGKVPAIWEIKPTILAADYGEDVDCLTGSKPCRRIPVLEALNNIRGISQGRTDLSKFARSCSPDPLVEPSEESLERRYCFLTKTLLTAQSCCKMQQNFSNMLEKAYDVPANLSLTGIVHAILLSFKVFFLLIVLVIGILLALWRQYIDKFYPDYVSYVERSILIGAFALLFWPLSNHAFLLSADLLYASFSDGIYGSLAPLMSILFGAWALMLLFFFFRRYEKDLEAAGKIIGVIGSMVAIVKYEEIIDYSVRIAGSGADLVTFGILAVIAIVIFIPLLKRNRGQNSGSDSNKQADIQPST